MVKKFFSLFLILLLAFSLISCKNDKDSENKESENSSNSQQENSQNDSSNDNEKEDGEKIPSDHSDDGGVDLPIIPVPQ